MRKPLTQIAKERGWKPMPDHVIQANRDRIPTVYMPLPDDEPTDDEPTPATVAVTLLILGTCAMITGGLLFFACWKILELIGWV